MTYQEILDRFPTLRVMVVGDIYLDENVFGAVTEISLEAPIPVYEVHERRYNPGAAGNAACNVASLGAQTYMVGLIGDDNNGRIVTEEFEGRGVDCSGLVVDPERPTNTYGKLRAGGHNAPSQEILRTDTPKPVAPTGALEARLLQRIRDLAGRVDAILVGDQANAVVTPQVLDTIRDVAREHTLWTVADSRARAGIFTDFDLIVPNDVEAGLAAGVEIVDEATLQQAGEALLKQTRNVFITQGKDGITWFNREGESGNAPARAAQVVDVTGAGDTVAATAMLVLAAGGSLQQAAELGNYAAGVAVGQPGVVTVPRSALEEALTGTGRSPKVKTLDAMVAEVKRLRQEGKRVVWTNGCFDILHVGHITYLLKAHEEGDVLIVGLNSDDSVRGIKGNIQGQVRPVVNENDRALVLSALCCVDYIIVFDEPTPMKALQALRPDVYVKGGDYSIDTIEQTERHFIESYGGRIAILPGVEGHSTTNIIDRVMRDELP